MFHLLSSTPHDKLGHFVAGVLIYAVVHFASPLVGLLMVVLAGFGKEIYDYLHRDKHTPDVYDALATLAGGFVAFVAGL